MERIAEPLRRMGVRVETTDGRGPLTVEGGAVTPITYELPVASAQVKSAVLLAGLYADGETTVDEPLPTRDHTENLLAQGGATVTRKPTRVTVAPATRLEFGEIDVPGDFSSAAPLIVAATLLAGSELTVHGVNLNPRRTGLLDVLERMGANVTVFNRRRVGGEPAGDLDVRPRSSSGRRSPRARCRSSSTSCRSSRSSPCTPAATASSAAPGAAGEGDRPDRGGRRRSAEVGAHIRATEDGFTVRGVPSRLRGGSAVDSRGDHRIAMLGAIAGLVSREGVEIRAPRLRR